MIAIKYIAAGFATGLLITTAYAFADDASTGSTQSGYHLREWSQDRKELWESDHATNQAERESAKQAIQQDRAEFLSGAKTERQNFLSGAKAQRDDFRAHAKSELESAKTLTGSAKKEALAKIKADRTALQEKLKTERDAKVADLKAKKQVAQATIKARKDAFKLAAAQRDQTRIQKDITNAGKLSAQKELKALTALLRTVNARLKMATADAVVTVYTQLQSQLMNKIAALSDASTTTPASNTLPISQ